MTMAVSLLALAAALLQSCTQTSRPHKLPARAQRPQEALQEVPLLLHAPHGRQGIRHPTGLRHPPHCHRGLGHDGAGAGDAVCLDAVSVSLFGGVESRRVLALWFESAGAGRRGEGVVECSCRLKRGG
jgi:hypothetical protein